MAFKFSTGFRNTVLGTESVKAAMDGGFLRIYAGTVPATADAALGGATLLVEISDNGGVGGLNMAATPADGALTKDLSQTWKGVNAAGGTATFFRFVHSADTGALSTTEVRIQGTVGLAGADMNLSSVALTISQDQFIDYFTLAFPTL